MGTRRGADWGPVAGGRPQASYFFIACFRRTAASRDAATDTAKPGSLLSSIVRPQGSQGVSMSSYDDAVSAMRVALPAQPALRDYVRFGTLAPNSHNTQPWKFQLGADSIDILPDFSRRTPIVDPDDHHLYVTLGCAAQNVVIAANATGRPADAAVRPNVREGTAIRVFLGS